MLGDRRTVLLLAILCLISISHAQFQLCDTTFPPLPATEQLRFNYTYNHRLCASNDYHRYSISYAPGQYEFQLQLCESSTSCDNPPYSEVTVNFQYPSTATPYVSGFPIDVNSTQPTTKQFPLIAAFKIATLTITWKSSTNLKQEIFYRLKVNNPDPCYDIFEFNNSPSTFNFAEYDLLNQTTLAACNDDEDYYYINTTQFGNVYVNYNIGNYNGDISAFFYDPTPNLTTQCNVKDGLCNYVTPGNRDVFFGVASVSGTHQYTMSIDYVQCLASTTDNKIQAPSKDYILVPDTICPNFPRFNTLQMSMAAPVAYVYVEDPDVTFDLKWQGVRNPPPIVGNFIDVTKFDPSYKDVFFTITTRYNKVNYDSLGLGYNIFVSPIPLCMGDDEFSLNDTPQTASEIDLWSADITYNYKICVESPDWYMIRSRENDKLVTVTIEPKDKTTYSQFAILVDGKVLQAGVPMEFILPYDTNVTIAITTTAATTLEYDIVIKSQKVLSLCGLDTPYECPDGSCAPSLEACFVRSECGNETSYQCWDGGCVSSPILCFTDCTAAYRCWNGKCADNAFECDLLPGCPIGYKRCWDGCKSDVNAVCIEECMMDQTACEDGSCVRLGDSCPPFNGCPLNQIQCPNGKCVTNVTECQVCIDCENPFTIQPFEYTYTFNREEALNQRVAYSDATDKNICYVNIPAGALVLDELHAKSDLFALRVRQVDTPLLSKIRTDNVLSGVVDFKIFSRFGLLNATFSNEVTISCRANVTQQTSLSNICLGFIDLTINKWKCVDLDLSKWQIDDDNFLFLNGTTTHFTSFGVLLGDDPTGDDSSDEGSDGGNIKKGEKVSSGVIIAVVVIAVVLIIAGMVGVYFYQQKQKNLENNDLRRGSDALKRESEA